MIDIFETMMTKKSHSAWKISGFKYVTSESFLLLSKISDSLKAIFQENNKRHSFFKSNNLRGHSDQDWVSILNEKENWARYKNNKSKTEQKSIDALNQDWDRQKAFALRSNESLVTSFDEVLFGLKHVQKAMKEFIKSGWQLPKEFRIKYGEYLKNLSAELEDTKKQIAYAMLLRLKAANFYRNDDPRKIPDVDDAIYYMAENLNAKKSLDSNEEKILPSEPRKTLVTSNCNYYVKFFDCIKSTNISKSSKNEKNEIDDLHWSKIINKQIFPLTKSVAHNKSEPSDKASKSEFSFAESDVKSNKKIAIPLFLGKFVPLKRQTPSLLYWQDNMILDFWAKRQIFLANLQCLWVNQQNPIDEESRSKIDQCIKLIEFELAKTISETPSFFPFIYKKMLGEWADCLKNIRAELQQAITQSSNKTHKPVTQMKCLETSEIEYRKNSPVFSSELKAPIYPDWKKPAYISASEASRFSINGSPQDYIHKKHRMLKGTTPSMIETSFRAHR